MLAMLLYAWPVDLINRSTSPSNKVSIIARLALGNEVIEMIPPSSDSLDSRHQNLAVTVSLGLTKSRSLAGGCCQDFWLPFFILQLYSA